MMNSIRLINDGIMGRIELINRLIVENRENLVKSPLSKKAIFCSK
jgi:hypothetical protein